MLKITSHPIKQRYVLYKPAASVEGRYKLIHDICQKKSKNIFSLDIVSFRFYNDTAGKYETWTKHKLLR